MNNPESGAAGSASSTSIRLLLSGNVPAWTRDLLGDFDHVPPTTRRSNRRRAVAAAFGELQKTGVFACIHGAATRVRYAALSGDKVFRGDSWAGSTDASQRS